ncbi:protein TolQ [Sneathiella chinensis]|uniref:Tol-Pal system protein TolQ n=1 Tax=Sneathiella chinensis TaxID=349750 RepID=A0ABQ5U3M9_9PROT|nr:protein TolQ [Sneathiella chinensis]GLQ06328.1 Tol-Pal system subunit TolQ [Sneathiella chinensis]
MENETLVAAQNLGAAAHDLSMISLFMRADIVVQLVMIVLILASFWCWAIIIDKIIKFRKVTAESDDFEHDFWSGGNLEDLYKKVGPNPDNPMAVLFASAMREWMRSTEKGLDKYSSAGLQARIHQVMRVAIDREMDRLEKYLGFLATVGSTATFLGLFGTVWGIMNSFQSIAATKDTSLAVVAPGIAEALFATALGLVAAIPAVVAYNKFSNDLQRIITRLEGFAGEFSAILSRQLDQEN